MMNCRLLVVFLTLVAALAASHVPLYADALDRLAANRLEATHKALEQLRDRRRELPRPGPFKEFRANLHVHSALSHDSRGTIDEIVSAAKSVGSEVLMFTEHPAETFDFFRDGHQGMRDGVLLIPGAETKGLLVFPRQSVRAFEAASPQEFSDLVRGRGGLSFLSHLEERLDWEIRGLCGVEIYNTHADFKDEKRLAAALRNPLWLLGTAELIRKYPQESFSALGDYPADYLRRFDQLCQRAPHTGIAANDAHQNVGLKIVLAEGDKVRVEDALGQRLVELDASVVSALPGIPKDAKAGATLFQLQLDRYEYSLRHVRTHLLMPELSREAVWEALEAGQAFVAFDWLADATGFDFSAESSAGRKPMGSRTSLADDLRFSGQSPLPGRWKLIRDGKAIIESTGSTFEAKVAERGVYRAEVWLNVAGEEKAWILSNPIYIVEK
jgi:hypothetical protein